MVQFVTKMFFEYLFLEFQPRFVALNATNDSFELEQNP
jgi:hypothetical protein